MTDVPGKTEGDRAVLGDTLGHPQDPYDRWARLVGIAKHERLFLAREFQPGDGWFPTGEYRQIWLICAWEGWRLTEDM